jgi:hypothetical protein
MDCLSKHKVLIDCAKKSIKLTTPDGKELEYVAEHVVTAKRATNCVKLNRMDAVTPGFKAKPNAHSMCVQKSSFHTYRTENGYRITNVSI